MEEPAMFWRDGDDVVGTPLVGGGWDPRHANGATVLALLGHCLEDVPCLVPMLLSRLTVDLVRPVPVGERLNVAPTILREGKKIQVVELRLLVDDVVHVRATALRLREADLSEMAVPASTTDERPADALARPEDSIALGATPDAPGFMGAVDLRRAPLADGSGHGSWLRPTAPIVAGEPIRVTSRLVLGFDFANLIGLGVHPDGLTMINPDVTGQVLRLPTGEWVAITGETRFNPAMGRGLSSAALSDEEGVFAFAMLSQLVQPR